MHGSLRSRMIVGVALELLLLATVVLLVALGDRTLTSGFVLYVDFDRVENLKEGAAVRQSGQSIGRVLAIRQGLGPDEPPLRAQLRLHLWIERDKGRFIRRNSTVFLAAKGVIGERYLEIGPFAGAPEPAAGEREVLRGVDPAMLDRLLQQGYTNMRAATALARELSPHTRELVALVRSVRAHLDELAPPAAVDRVHAQTTALVAQTRGLVGELRAATDDGRLVSRTLRRVEELGARHGDGVAGLGRRVDELSRRLDELAALVGPAERRQLASTLARLRLAADAAAQTMVEVAAIRRRLDSGRGTIGRLLTDPTLNDDIKDAHRRLKEAPWRALARPPRDQAPRGARRRPSAE